jgi:hypothetical protein
MKVYCNDCRYFEEWYYMRLDYHDVKCKSPSNIKTKNTWKEILYFYPISPKKKNKNNDCDWYKEK